MTTSITTVLFDLDGTLVDSAPDIANSLNRALSLHALPNLDLARICEFIGNGADRLVHRAITNQYDGHAESNIYDSVRGCFGDFYESAISEHSRLYPGVSGELERLQAAGYQLACVTNKPHRFTIPLLEQLGIDKLFAICVSGDTLENKKPAPDQLLYAAAECASEPSNCTMIGDTHTDMTAAMRANMPGVYCRYGYGDEGDLDPRFNGHSIDSITELTHILEIQSGVRELNE